MRSLAGRAKTDRLCERCHGTGSARLADGETRADGGRAFHALGDCDAAGRAIKILNQKLDSEQDVENDRSAREMKMIAIRDESSLTQLGRDLKQTGA